MPADFTGTIGVETDRAKLARNSGINTNFLAQRKNMTHTQALNQRPLRKSITAKAGEYAS